jgi:hypothetical protein
MILMEIFILTLVLVLGILGLLIYIAIDNQRIINNNRKQLKINQL